VGQVVEPPGELPVGADGQPEVGQRVGVVGVAAELGDQQLRLERADQRRHHRVERGEVQVVGGARRQRQVGDGAAGGALADLVGEPGAGEQVAPGLVHRDRQHPGLLGEDRLDPVAVVDVDVDVGDPLDALLQQPGDRHRRVVVDAEAAGPVAHGVVEAAGGREGVQGAAGADRLRRRHGGAAHPGGGLVHAGELGRVARPDAVGEVRVAAGAGRLHRGQVVEVVDAGEVGPGERHRLGKGGAVQQPAGAGQRHGELDPCRSERVLRPEVVGGQLLVPDHAHRTSHGSQLPLPPPDPPRPPDLARVDFRSSARPVSRR
jgi:hypothetical protein